MGLNEQVPQAPPRPSPKFLDPVARPHVVCPINACIINGIAMLTGGLHAELRFAWDWTAGCMAAGFANVVLLMALTIWLPQSWHGGWPGITTAVSMFALLAALAMSSIG